MRTRTQKQKEIIASPSSPIETISPTLPSEEDTDSEEENLNNDELESESETESQVSEESRPPARRQQTPFANNGKIVFKNEKLYTKVQEISHKRFSRFNVGDHLYSLSFFVNPKTKKPYLLEMEKALHVSLVSVLKALKLSYPASEDFQVYLTVLGPGIKSGLNSGNYSLRTPSEKIVRWMLSMLYNFLKSNQQMKLQKTFHVKIKVLSVEHTKHLQRNKKKFRKHVYH